MANSRMTASGTACANYSTGADYGVSGPRSRDRTIQPQRSQMSKRGERRENTPERAARTGANHADSCGSSDDLASAQAERTSLNNARQLRVLRSLTTLRSRGGLSRAPSNTGSGSDQTNDHRAYTTTPARPPRRTTTAPHDQPPHRHDHRTGTTTAFEIESRSWVRGGPDRCVGGR